MRTYDTYKDSGISWLGQIPSHWDVKRAKVLFNKENRPVLPNDEVVTCFRDGQVTLRKNRRTEGFTESLKEIGYQGIRKGDLVIHQMDAFAGATGVSDSNGKGTPVYHVCTPKTDYVNNYYYAHIVRRMGLNGYIQSLYRGIRERSSDFRFDVFGRQFLPVPPLTEQKAIVAYLDKATAEIDKAIASQQRMVELLQERKQIIINQAVTQGLNPDAPMKPTNIDWLPQIPTHWQLKKIKYVVLLKSGQNLTSEQIEKEDLYPVYGGNGLRGYYSDYNNDGDYVLIGRQGALCGNINYAHNKFWATEHAVVCYPVDRVNVLWLGETLRAMNLNRYATASAQPGLAVENIKGLMMPVPDYKEQNDIAVFIEKQTKPIDESIESCNRMIGALSERKQILINDVVTGKIKVV